MGERHCHEMDTEPALSLPRRVCLATAISCVSLSVLNIRHIQRQHLLHGREMGGFLNSEPTISNPHCRLLCKSAPPNSDDRQKCSQQLLAELLASMSVFKSDRHQLRQPQLHGLRSATDTACRTNSIYRKATCVVPVRSQRL